MSGASTRIGPSLLRRWPLPEVTGDGGKEDRGRALVVGGSVEIPGAVILAATGALRAGAGKLQIATCREVATAIAVAIPEARVIGLRSARDGAIAPRSCRAILSEVDRCDALLVGPGMVEARAVFELIRRRTGRGGTLVADAGALRFWRGRKELPSPGRGATIITPHAGEMADLWGIERSEVLAHPLEVARQAAAYLGVVVVLKGACTYVAAPDGRAYHNTAGNVGLGTSGSGDALSGIIAGLAARGADAVQSAVWGVHLHARAGDMLARKMGMLGFLARELLAEIPPLLARSTVKEPKRARAR
ncbi:MAG TPA: NAD(P)H-hydrate dehydratase [Polyangiaceae bacterium]|nr:NAD(P)H-hydrate dehydratase [Polyangiaceae bacterium]